MPNFICTTCGTQHAETEAPPLRCAICEDERQYVGWGGQQWTTMPGLRQTYQITVRLEELGLDGIGMEPSFATDAKATVQRSADRYIRAIQD